MKTTIVKTSFLAAVMFVTFTVSAFARPTDVSKSLLRQFQKQFSHATHVAWKTTNSFTSATFMLNGDRTSVFYNNDNDVIGISRIVSLEELPKAAQQTIGKKFGNQMPTSVIDFTDANGNENYYVQFDYSNGKQVILQADEAGHVSDFQKQ